MSGCAKRRGRFFCAATLAAKAQIGSNQNADQHQPETQIR